ncbi:hypothetical protein Ciccas_013076 [Cichlidogyrus casuarinus]|uniref:Uncharacterized protein n=1 Tax=Cichlidogyrus casuarinus TaxID=1844966 RepID=A0ABD2PMA8_9PLAT
MLNAPDTLVDTRASISSEGLQTQDLELTSTSDHSPGETMDTPNIPHIDDSNFTDGFNGRAHVITPTINLSPNTSSSRASRAQKYQEAPPYASPFTTKLHAASFISQPYRPLENDGEMGLVNQNSGYKAFPNEACFDSPVFLNTNSRLGYSMRYSSDFLQAI